MPLINLKNMSRQEFAVVAITTYHYLGCTTEDPTASRYILPTGPKFVARLRQDAVRELASLGFTLYARHIIQP